VEKGKIMVKRAYADWERYLEYKRPFHEAAIELIDIPQKKYSGKNSADIRLVVDAMDLAHGKEHLDTFVIVSGDSDFSPLVSKLRENDKYVIGMGVKNSSSELLVDNCDEFIYYEDLVLSLSEALRQAISRAEKLPKSDRPIPIVLSGGTAKPRGFKELFDKALKSKPLPIEIGQLRMASDPLTATARGALIAAMYEK
jgi:hypothetical protein